MPQNILPHKWECKMTGRKRKSPAQMGDFRSLPTDDSAPCIGRLGPTYSVTPCAAGFAMQHSPTGFPEPQKHGSPFLQHSPAFLPEPHAHGAINSAFFASSILKM
jgi:hypothetical protein